MTLVVNHESRKSRVLVESHRSLVVLMAAETLNGLWRAKVLALWIGDAAAHDVSVFTGSIVILLITFACIGWIPAHRSAHSSSSA
jgi:hypothetical protein